MEEVIGSIPIRSTNHFRHLEAPPFRDLVAFFVADSKALPETYPGLLFSEAAIDSVVVAVTVATPPGLRFLSCWLRRLDCGPCGCGSTLGLGLFQFLVNRVHRRPAHSQKSVVRGHRDAECRSTACTSFTVPFSWASVAHTEQRQSAGLPAVSVPAVAVRDPRSVIGRRPACGHGRSVRTYC